MCVQVQIAKGEGRRAKGDTMAQMANPGCLDWYMELAQHHLAKA
jgi:hypothetical protein